MSYAFIINPVAAAGKTLKKWNEVLEPALKSKGVEYKPFFTERQTHAIELARDAATVGGFKNVISIGGDGTFHEVINGLLDENGKSVKAGVNAGIICSGTGSDFIKTVNIPRDPAAALEVVLKGNAKPLDVIKGSFSSMDGKQISKYSINVADAGFGGTVVDIANHSSKIFGGKFTFLSAALKAILKSKPIPARIELDGKEPRDVGLIAIFFGNGKFNGGGIRCTMDAVPDDGIIDVCMLEGITKKMKMISILLNFYKDHDVVEATIKKNQEHMYYGKHKKARVVPSGNDTILLDFDGEMVGKAPLEVEILPSAVNVLLP
jgi:YegS/Rv2252/BmrU family lipid kinase